MVYLPFKVVTVEQDRLYDHHDLSAPLNSFTYHQSYLIVAKNKFYYALDLSKILLFEKQLVMTASVATALSARLTDQFVAAYRVPYLPGTNPFIGVNGLRVFDPSTTRKHQVHFSSIHTPEIVDDPRQKGFLDDLVIVSKEDMKYYLVAVNGVFHPTTYQDGKLWVLDGFRTIRLSGRHDVTVVDTSLIGGHRIIPLTTDNVEKSEWMKDALVTLSQPVTNSNVFVVIDGYFYHRDTHVLDWQTPTKAYLRANKLTLIEQFRHNPRTFLPGGRWQQDEAAQSRRYTDTYQSVFSETWSVPSNTLQTKDFQYSRLTSFHSFLVAMNNDRLYTVSEELDHAGNPQFFTHQGETYLSGMMRYGCGLSPSYAIWGDPEGRQSVFIAEQIGDKDYQSQSADAPLIPTPDQQPATRSATMINYISV